MILGYLRVSTDKQTVENQRFEIMKFAQEKHLTIDRWVEETVSGTKRVSERRLGKIFKHFKKGDILITSELSRLGRNLMQVMGLLHECMENGITLMTVKERYELGNDINAKILAFAFSLSAEIERNLISMRTKEALQKKTRRSTPGTPQGKSTPLQTDRERRTNQKAYPGRLQLPGNLQADGS